jgi:hypothetical protein
VPTLLELFTKTNVLYIMERVVYRKEIIKNGISFGSVLAIVISWTLNKSIVWAIIHGLLGWLYVLYYVIRFY